MELNEEEAKHTWDILTHFKSNPYRFSGNKEMISACSNSFAGDSKRNQFQMNKTRWEAGDASRSKWLDNKVAQFNYSEIIASLSTKFERNYTKQFYFSLSVQAV